jgi:hypothetical protein
VRERFQTILTAYLAASLAAGVSLALGFSLFAFVGALLGQRWQAAGSAAVALIVVPLILGGWAAFFVVFLALVPALVVIGIAEVVRVRAAAFYAGAGTITGLACLAVLARRQGDWFAVPALALASIIEWAVFGVAGLIGGLVYWLIAGSNAGVWQLEQRPGP